MKEIIPISTLFFIFFYEKLMKLSPKLSGTGGRKLNSFFIKTNYKKDSVDIGLISLILLL